VKGRRGGGAAVPVLADARRERELLVDERPTSGWALSIWLMPEEVSETAVPRGRAALTSKMQPMWMSPDRNT
jgi:hypothetical protein